MSYVPYRDTMGKRIRELREAIGLTRSQFAEIIEISEGKLANIENNHQKPQADDIERLCSIFTWATHYVVYGAELSWMPESIDQKELKRITLDYVRESIRNASKKNA
ncbi:helix-turn-helix domain-containing protein [Gynuella sunshinyii]|uniref:helix-turn-helix domain-containing protein n=1 Tax=Gynuella sunshinyii TaxID=1445505 RepID=UPI00069A4B5F|nr:helix-turn-helix transcriptional regulator [Gynuella sunshinyii]